MNPLIPTSDMLNKNTTVLLQGWILHKITHEGWNVIKQRNQTNLKHKYNKDKRTSLKISIYNGKKNHYIIVDKCIIVTYCLKYYHSIVLLELGAHVPGFTILLLMEDRVYHELQILFPLLCKFWEAVLIVFSCLIEQFSYTVSSKKIY